MRRIFLRMNGAAGGCMAKVPETFNELFKLADAKLFSKLPEATRACRVFIASGDEISAEEFDCIEHDDVLYFSAGEDWIAPPSKKPDLSNGSGSIASHKDTLPKAACPSEGTRATPLSGPPTSNSRELPPGWAVVECISSTGKVYKRYAGPTGKPKVQSIAEAWRLYQKSQPQNAQSGVGSEGTQTPNLEVSSDFIGQGDACTPAADAAGEAMGELGVDESEEVFEVEAIVGKRAVELASAIDANELPGSTRPPVQEWMTEELQAIVTRAGLSLEGCEDAAVLLQRASDAQAAELQRDNLKRPPPAPHKMAKARDDPTQQKRRKVGSAEAAVEREKREAEKREAAERREAERVEREEVKALERAMEKQRKAAEREAEKKKKEEERLAKLTEKEVERLRKEEERKEKEAERLLKEKARAAKLEQADAAKKRRSIVNFFGSKPTTSSAAAQTVVDLTGAPPLAKKPRVEGDVEIVPCAAGAAACELNTLSSPGKSTGDAGDSEGKKQIYLRGGKRVVPFYVPDYTRLAAMPHERPPSYGKARQYMQKLVDFLSKRAAGDLGAKAPRLPLAMRRQCRREALSRAKKGAPSWQWAPLKTLSFHEDVRPAYQGTFTRPSVALNSAASSDTPSASAFGEVFGFGGNCSAPTQDMDDSPASLSRSTEQFDLSTLGDGSVCRRRPFGRDNSLFDYEVDSEAEWEPEEEGEDLGSEVDGEEKDEEEGMSDDEQDDWLVRDDAEEGQPVNSRSSAPPALTPSLLLGRLLSGMQPSAGLQSYSVQRFEGTLPPSLHPPAGFTGLGRAPSSLGTDDVTVVRTPVGKGLMKPGKPVQTLPPKELPRLAALVHGNTAGLAKIIDTFRDATVDETLKASRAQIEKEIRSMATREMGPAGKVCWLVRAELVEEMGVSTPGPSGSSSAAKMHQEKSALSNSAQLSSGHPTQVLHPAMRAFIKPVAMNADSSEKPPGNGVTNAKEGEDAVKMLFTGETSA
ncbi:hypothetical protein AB1Y20_018707 [Prymnesium parvum]|uniref:Chromatin assembly factor 1 subunit A dimerization domain-containing protein n=1 Tax=Prymnesium parvum TaxID=97485 RepID=A0AB34JP18_PRYPA